MKPRSTNRKAPPPLKTTTLEPSEHNWLLHRDLAAKQSVLEVVNDQGRFRIDDTGTEIHRSNREWYTTTDDTFTSAQGETYTEHAFKRDDWDVEIYTRTILTCTADTFVIHAQLDAYEENYRVFSKNWERTIPRDNV